MTGGWHSIDWAVLGAYFACVAYVGWRAHGRQEDSADYFLGGRSLPWWAAAFSIVATETSAVTYVGVPASAYSDNWSILRLVAGFIIGRLFLAFFFVRVLYRGGWLTVYGYLAERFGARTRTVAALLFLAGRVIASGVRLYAGCLAFCVATAIDLDIAWVILLLGGFGTLLTWYGGVRTVVWTDVILGLTLIAGGLCAAGFLVAGIDGGLSGVFASSAFAEKTAVLARDVRGAIVFFDGFADDKALLIGLAFGFVLTLATHGTDQDVAQRMLTCRDSRSGSLSIIGSAVLIVPLFLLFLSIGTLLWFFHESGSATWPVPEAKNELFPLFIAHGLPPGVSGFVVAGLLAAALSSFTSALNALASTAIGDFWRPLVANRSEHHYLRAGKVATLILAALLLLAALGFIGTSENIFALSLQVFTYVYGALLGAFLLGVLSRRGSDGSVFAGMLVSVGIVVVLQLGSFLRDIEHAPDGIRRALGMIPPGVRELLVANLPDVAPGWWIIVGTLTCGAIGAIGRPMPSAAGQEAPAALTPRDSGAAFSTGGGSSDSSG